MIHVTKCRCAL